MNSEETGTKLGIWTRDAETWRKENGYTSEAWEMYYDNMNLTGNIALVVGLLLGIVGTCFVMSIFGV